jgi:hypothetical protein
MLENNLPSDIFYVPAYTLYDRSTWTFDPVKIAKLAQHALVIIDYSTENYNESVLTEYNYFAQLGINFILLSHDPTHHLSKPNLLFYPYWLDWSQSQLKFPASDLTFKRYKIASMSRSPRAHRIVNYIMLRDKPYFDSVVITAHRETGDMSQITRADDVVVPEIIQTQWDRIKDSLPPTTIEQLRSAFNVVHPGYTDSYAHLIVETSVSRGFFVTEKTWQVVASGQLFLVWGSCGTIGHLQDMGVDVFDDFVDHKYYDTEQDPLTRLHRIHTVLDDLAAQDLQNIYAQTLSRRESNIAKFRNSEFGIKYRDQLTTCINMLN